MDCSTPSFPVLHYLLEFVQVHVHITFNGFRQMYNDIYLPLQYHMEYFFTLKILCALFIHSFLHSHLLQLLETTDPFTVSVVFSIPEFHIHGIIQYVAFLEWLLSLNIMYLRFLHVFSWLNSSFIFTPE